MWQPMLDLQLSQSYYLYTLQTPFMKMSLDLEENDTMVTTRPVN